MRSALRLYGTLAFFTLVIALGLARATPAAPSSQAPLVCDLGPWTVVSPVPQAAAAIAVAGDGTYAYAAGGAVPGAVLNRVARYDAPSNSWATLANLPTGADGIGMVYYNGKLYALGGADSHGNGLAISQVYDIAFNTWTSGAPLPGPRSRAATLVDNGTFYLIGGSTTRNAADGQIQNWQFGAGGFVDGAPLPQARVAPGYGVVNGHIYVIGGLDTAGNATTTVFNYDIAADTWTTGTAPLPVAVAGPASAVVGGRIVLAGGGTPTLGALAPLTTTLTQIYDPALNSWSSGPALNVGRAFVGGTTVGGSVVTVGGSDSLGGLYATTEVSQIQAACPTNTPTATDTPAPSATPTDTPRPPATNTPLSSATPTATATLMPKPTATPTPGVCITYAITVGQGRLLPGSTDIGNHCDDCATDVNLPFYVPIYDGPLLDGPDGPPIMHGRFSANGYVTFTTATPTPGAGNIALTGGGNMCLPAPGFSYTVFPHWDDLRTDCAGCGIFTAVVGCSPNRTFVAEWRAAYVTGGGTADFALELHEDRSDIDMIYGVDTQQGSGATVGIQRDPTTAVQFECNTGGLTDGLHLTFTRETCALAGASSNPTEGNPPPAASGTPAGVTPTACPITFSDVPPANPFYGYIRCLACRGILSGYADGTFRPGNPITRAQVAKILSNSAGFAECIPAQQTFADVPPTQPFWPYIERNVNYQVISGYACGGPDEPCDPQNRPYFRPNANITRGQLAKIAANAAGYHETVPATQQTFADVPPGSPFWFYVERLHNRSIISGYACGGPGEPCDSQHRPYYRPGGLVTRAQTAKIAALTFYPTCPTP